MTKRMFTVEEANRALPLVRVVATDVVREYGELAGKAAAYRRLRDRTTRDADDEARLNGLKQEMAALSDVIDGFVAEIGEIGCEMKDLEIGLVDFPAELDDREIRLCWKVGEERVEFWHETTEGFSGRKPLSVTVPED